MVSPLVFLPSINLATRPCISSEALLVKVMAAISLGE